MSGLRLAASQRELVRTSPLLAFEMQQNPDRVSPAPDVTVGGVTYKAAAYRVGAQTLTVMFDPATGLPARVRSLDYDNVWGDVTYDLVLSDWQVVDGVRVAYDAQNDINAVVNPEQVEAIEVFRGPSEIPVEYNDNNSQCGVILVWTRKEP